MFGLGSQKGRIRVVMRFLIGTVFAALLLALLTQLLGCSGGGSFPPPATPDFSLAVSPTSQTVDAGNSVSVSLSATGLNGFTSSVSVQVTGIPSGVTVSPTSLTLQPGTPQQVTLTAAASLAAQATTVTFTGTSGSLTHTVALSVTVNGTYNGVPVRTRYLRTDATTEYFAFPNLHWAIYSPTTSRFFVTDPYSNHVFVFDPASETQIGTINVPGAYGIDDTPDHSTLYVGTLIGDVYALDPVAMSVKQRYLASQIGPSGYPAMNALVLADGRLALLPESIFAATDGSSSFAIWNPSDNSFTLYYGTPNWCFPVWSFTRTADRTKVISNSLCELDESTGSFNYVETSAGLTTVATPDGKYLIGVNVNADEAVLYDPNTLSLLGTIPLNISFFDDPFLAVSADSKTLFLMNDTRIYAYDIATSQEVGWAPSIDINPISSGSAAGPVETPFLQAVDSTGLFIGPLEEGVGFVDLSSLQSLPVGTQFTNGYLNPATGPASGGTGTEWSDPNPFGSLKDIYFGSKQATNSGGSSGYIHATSPSGAPGPADVYAFTNDGGMQLLPEAFSYGPTIVEVAPNMATAEGGGNGFVFGYGLGPVTSNSIPSDLQVTIAGVAAQVTSYASSIYPSYAPPYPMESASYTIPQGTVGSGSVTVTTHDGSTTAQAPFTYLPPIQSFPLTGSSLAQGIYDSFTDLYYFTDANQIQIFSRTQGHWLAPIAIPASKRLWGIALSPDGNTMAVSDAQASAIYTLDPTNPASLKTFQIPLHQSAASNTNPSGVAVSNAGSVYYAEFPQTGDGLIHTFFKLDTPSGSIRQYAISGTGSSDVYLRAAITADNSGVYINGNGYLFSVDTSTDTVSVAEFHPPCACTGYDLALSSSQTNLSAGSYLYDLDMNGQSQYALNDREVVNIAYVYGAKFSPDGRLLFQPSTIGIDVLDGNLGNLLGRISISAPMSPVYDALVSNGKDNILMAITGSTGNGIAVLDLTSIAEPSLLPYSKKTARAHHVGNVEETKSTKLNSHLEARTAPPGTLPHTPPHVTRSLLEGSK
jgi:hypothetical protein